MSFEKASKKNEAFTLIELLMGMTLALIVMSSIYKIYASQQYLYRNNQLIIESQQNLRGAITVLEQQLRMAGYDPKDTGRFGIVDVRRYAMIEHAPDTMGKPAIGFLRDYNENGSYDGGGEKISFSIRKDPNIGRTYLAWNLGSGRFPLAENIQEIGFAYAVDVDKDGYPDTYKGTDHILWFVDSDNDNFLDAVLDVNHDGVIDQYDDVDGDNRISSKDNSVLYQPIGLDRIKLIRIWVMAKTRLPLRGYIDHRSYIVGDRIIKPENDGFYRTSCELVVDCRNL